jgi:DNA-binding transcriptional ArsR family regulator
LSIDSAARFYSCKPREILGFFDGFASEPFSKRENYSKEREFHANRLKIPAAQFFQKFFLPPNRFAILFNQMVKYQNRMLDRTFAALADPTRRRILANLAEGERCVTALAAPHRMSLPAISKHLRVLEKAGLIRRKRQGRRHQLKLEAAPMQQAQQWIEEYRRFWEQSFDRLDEYLKQLQAREKDEHNK